MNIALIGLVGVALGAIIQFFAARAVENHRLKKANQRDAYNAFLAALSLVAHADNESLVAAKRDLANAKSMVALYGSPEVVALLANLFQEHDTLQGIIAQFKMTNILVCMRDDVNSSTGKGLQANMFPLLFQ